MATQYFPLKVLLRIKEIENYGVLSLQSISHQKNIVSKILQDPRLPPEKAEQLALAVLNGEYGIQIADTQNATLQNSQLNGSSTEGFSEDEDKSVEGFTHEYDIYKYRHEVKETNPSLELCGSEASISMVSRSEVLERHNKLLATYSVDSVSTQELHRLPGPGGGYCFGDKYFPSRLNPIIVEQTLPVELGLSSSELGYDRKVMSAANLALETRSVLVERTRLESERIRSMLETRKAAEDEGIEKRKELKRKLITFRKKIFKYLRVNNYPQAGQIMRCVDEGLAFEFMEKFHGLTMPIDKIVSMLVVELGSALLPGSEISTTDAFVRHNDGRIFSKAGSQASFSTDFPLPIGSDSTSLAGKMLLPHTAPLTINPLERAVSPKIHLQGEELFHSEVIGERRRGCAINNTPFLYPLPYSKSFADAASPHRSPWNHNEVASQITVSGGGFRSTSPEAQRRARTVSPQATNTSPKRKSHKKVLPGISSPAASSSKKKRGTRAILGRGKTPEVSEEDYFEGDDIDPDGVGEDGLPVYKTKAGNKPHKGLKAIVAMHQHVDVEDIERKAEHFLKDEFDTSDAAHHDKFGTHAMSGVIALAVEAAHEQQFIARTLKREMKKVGFDDPAEGDNAKQETVESFVDTMESGLMSRFESLMQKQKKYSRFMADTAKKPNSRKFVPFLSTSGLSSISAGSMKESPKLEQVESIKDAISIQNKELSKSRKSTKLQGVTTKSQTFAGLLINRKERELMNGAGDSVTSDLLMETANALAVHEADSLPVPTETANSARVSPGSKSMKLPLGTIDKAADVEDQLPSSTGSSKNPAPKTSRSYSGKYIGPISGAAVVYVSGRSNKSGSSTGRQSPTEPAPKLSSGASSSKGFHLDIVAPPPAVLPSDSTDAILTDRTSPDMLKTIPPPWNASSRRSSKSNTARETAAVSERAEGDDSEGGEVMQPSSEIPIASSDADGDLYASDENDTTEMPSDLQEQNEGKDYDEPADQVRSAVVQSYDDSIRKPAFVSAASIPIQITSSNAVQNPHMKQYMYYNKFGVLSLSPLERSLGSGGHAVFTSATSSAVTADDSKLIPSSFRHSTNNSTPFPALLSSEPPYTLNSHRIPSEIASARRSPRVREVTEVAILAKKTFCMRDKQARVQYYRSEQPAGERVYFDLEQDSTAPVVRGVPPVATVSTRIRQDPLAHSEDLPLDDDRSINSNNETAKDMARTKKGIKSIGSLSLLKGAKNKKLHSLRVVS